MTVADATLGALEIGTLISTFLYGIMTILVHMYAKGGVDDARKVKGAVSRQNCAHLPHTNIGFFCSSGCIGLVSRTIVMLDSGNNSYPLSLGSSRQPT